MQCKNNSKNAAVPRWPLQHFGQSLRSQERVHLLAFKKLIKTEACTRHARPDSALTSDTGIAISKVADGRGEKTTATEFIEKRTATGHRAGASTIRQWKTQKASR